MSTTTPASYTDETFERLLSGRAEPEWLRASRRRWWDVFRQMEWPDRRSEEWMRTDIRLFRLDRYALPLEPPADRPSLRPLLAEGVRLGGRLESVNGWPAAGGLDAKWAERGVLFGPLGQLAAERPGLVEQHLMTRAFDPEYDRFAALHAACWSGGCFLYVPRGVVVDEPFHVLSGLTGGASDLGHTLVVLEEGAEATLVAETAGPPAGGEAGGFHCGGAELLLGPGARLRYVGLQNWSQGVWHFAHQKAVLDRDAQLEWTISALGSRLAKVNQHVELAGPGAGVQVNGVLFAEDKQHVSFHTVQHHSAPGCRSDFLYKAALQDNAHTVWRGMIKVDPGAQKTDGYQRNDNLLLAPNARADSIPGLEIEADDVRCTHAATSGRVDDELVFYAMCRGFTRREAVRLIVSGFFQQVFDRITIDSVRQTLGAAIQRRVREYA